MVLSVGFHFLKWLPAGIGPRADSPHLKRQTMMQTFDRRGLIMGFADIPDIEMEYWRNAYLAPPIIRQYAACPPKLALIYDPRTVS